MNDESITSIVANHADDIFFPNIRELLKILAVLPIGIPKLNVRFHALEDCTHGLGLA